MKALGGTPQKYFPTDLGKRYIDRLVNGIAHESKVGRTSLTSKIQVQINKDMELLASGEIRGSVWHFFKSPVTGLTGPTPALEQALKDAGIAFVVH